MKVLLLNAVREKKAAIYTALTEIAETLKKMEGGRDFPRLAILPRRTLLPQQPL